jgi:hypothetical protein
MDNAMTRDVVIAGALVGVIGGLILVGIVSHTLFRHFIQVVPAGIVLFLMWRALVAYRRPTNILPLVSDYAWHLALPTWRDSNRNWPFLSSRDRTDILDRIVLRFRCRLVVFNTEPMSTGRPLCRLVRNYRFAGRCDMA